MIDAYRGDFYALMTAISWSVAVIFYKHSGRLLNPIPLKTFHNFLAVVLLLISLLALGEPLGLQLTTSEWLRLVVSAILGITFADTLYVAAINRIGAGLQAVVDGLYTPFVVILAYLFLGETLPTMTLWGGALVVAATIIAQMDIRHLGITRRNLVVGIAFALTSQLAMAACVLLIRDLLRSHSILTITFHRYLWGSALLVLVSLKHMPWKALGASFVPNRNWKVLLPGVFLGPYLSTLLWFAGFKYSLAGRAAIYNQMSTIITVVLAAMFLGERLTLSRVIAVILAIAGSFIVLSSPM